MVGLELDLQDGVGETGDILGRELTEGPVDSDILTLPVLAGTDTSIVILTNQGQLGIERDTDTGIVLKLEGGTAIEGTDGGAHLLADNAGLNIVGELLHELDILDRLLAARQQLGEFDVHGVGALEVWVDVLCLDGETLLDTLLTSPLFTMDLALQEALSVVGRLWSIPTTLVAETMIEITYKREIPRSDTVLHAIFQQT